MKTGARKTFSNYEILEEIGAGGMAVVYKARQKLLGRVVALKVLHEHLARDRVFVQRFLREARDAARLQHPNIVEVYDCGEENGRYYIAMEYLEGENLAHMVKTRGALPLPLVVSITQQIASALDYAHREGIVHRDVKPSNIIVSSDGHATLTDFSIAKASTDASLTATGLFVGTPAYVSPEQARGAPVDHRGDVYSLAIVCYEMLTGRPPFQGDTIAVLHGHAYDTPPPMRSLNPSLPKELEGVIRRGLEKDPLKRYGSAGELARALEMVTRSVLQEKPRTSQRVPWPIGVMLLVIVFGGILGYLLSGAREKGTSATPVVVSLPTRPTVPNPSREVSTEEVTATPTSAQKVVKARRPVLVRSKPGGEGAPLGSVPAGANLDLVGRWDGGPWVQVCCLDGSLGWAEASALGLENREVEALPVVEVALAPSPTPMPTHQPTFTSTRPVPTPTFTSTRPVPTPTFTSTRPVPTPTPTPRLPGLAYSAPQLWGPPDGSSFVLDRGAGRVCLSWGSVGTLEDDDYYVVLIQSKVRGGGVWTDVQQTKETSLCAPEYILGWPVAEGRYTWSVSVRRLPGGRRATPEDPGEPVSDPSATWSFFWSKAEEPSGAPPPPPEPTPTPRPPDGLGGFSLGPLSNTAHFPGWIYRQKTLCP